MRSLLVLDRADNVQRKMRIAITADPEIPVPPKHYGGIERIVDLLVRGLVNRGHDITLFAHADSFVPCKLQAYPGCRSRSGCDLLRNMWHVSYKVARGGYDLVHSFGRLAYLLPILPLQISKLMTYQRAITARSVLWSRRLGRGTLHFSGCSAGLIEPYARNGDWHVVYNGVPLDSYKFVGETNGHSPLVFLGRLEEIKGVHLAIEVARRSGYPLLIAGNIPNEVKHRSYFDAKVLPHIDGKTIQYVGPVDDIQKNSILGNAVALLMPVLWHEPFGIVMAEALACGTPIIGLNRGAVAEVVQHGVNGFVCESVGDMVQAVSRLSEIVRSQCRRIAEEKFSDRATVNAYESLYRRFLGEMSPSE